MTNLEHAIAHPELSLRAANLVGIWSAIITAVLTTVTFGMAITAIPISGAYCLEGCVDYPYLNTVAQYPKDYLWMIPAIILTLSYMVWMVSVNVIAAPHKKIFSHIGLSFALLATLLLVSDYFIQFSVIPISLMKGETEGIALLTQYNPHGIFIVLEELGYLLMGLSFLFIAPVFSNKNRLEAAVRWIFISAFVLAIVFLVIFSIQYGLDREYRFEVAIISIDWLVLLINGILMGVYFRRVLKLKKDTREV